VTSKTGTNKGAIVRAYVPKRDGTAAVALYLPQLLKFTTCKEDNVKK